MSSHSSILPASPGAGPPDRSPLKRYGAALGSTAAVWLLNLSLLHLDGPESPFLLFPAAILLSAWYGGRGPGLLAALLSTAAVLPSLAATGDHPGFGQIALRIVLYAFQALLLCFFGHGLERSSREGRRQAAEVEAARRRETEALRFGEERFRMTLKNSPIVVYTADRELRYTWIHNSQLGMAADAVLGKRDDELLPPDQARTVMDLKRAVLESGVGARRELTLSLNGRTIHYDITVEPQLDESGEIVGLTAAAVNITDRKKAEAALQESEERLRLALESSDLIAWEMDPATGRTAPMGDVVHILGTTEDEITSAEQYFRFVHPEDRERAWGRLQATLQTGVPLDVDYRFVRPDGTIRWVNDRGRVARDLEGRPVRMSGMLRDITDRKEAEEGLRQAKQAAEEASQAKDRFLATLSHELRTPLTPVLVVTASLEEDRKLPERLRADLAMIRRNIELEARLIDDLLDLTRVAHGKLELHNQITDVHRVIEHAIQTCCSREAESGRLRLDLDLAARDHRVWGDTSRLSQVLWNLLNNAVKFTPAGGRISVRTWNGEPDSDSRQELIVEVTDTGIGIAPEALPRIFDAFEQGDRRITRRYGGLGLGLAVSRAILELHGGHIETASEGIGKGATFRFRLPVDVLTPDAQDEAAPAMPAGVLPGSAPGSNEPLRILLVEDHADTAEAMADLLRDLGHQVTTAMTVTEALRTAADLQQGDQEGIDLVISDLGLPDGTGHDLMRELVRRYGVRGIALSGYGMEEDIRKSLEAGFDRHLIKPVSPQLLRSVIDQAARGQRAPSA
ncbi:MAG TPA: ATP-binding protein [Thermoanaerobaculia bacterium]|nr:ATP-binding protein [Thermoanaerobaculia bacterium]